MSIVFKSCLKSLPQKCDGCVLIEECEEKQLYEKGRQNAIDELVVKLEKDMPDRLTERERYGYVVALNIVLEQLKEQK